MRFTECGLKVAAVVSYFSCGKLKSQNTADPWKLYRPESVVYRPHLPKSHIYSYFKGFASSSRSVFKKYIISVQKV